MATYRETVLTTPGLISLWALDELSGSTAVDQVSGRNGTVTGAAMGAAGLVPADPVTCYSFASGATDRVAVPFHADFATGNITVEAVFKATGFNIGSSVLNRRAPGNVCGWSFQQHSTTEYYWDIYAGGAFRRVLTAGWVIGTTYHVACTYDGTTSRVYRDGVEIGSTAYTGAINTPASATIELGRAIDASASFPGSIQFAAVYGAAIGPSTVLAHFNALRNPPEAAVTPVGSGGDIIIDHELWRATIDNQLIEDITDVFTGGQVSYNSDRAIRHEATFSVSDAARIQPYVDYLAVFINREYVDGREPQRDQLGLYTTKVPPGTRTVEVAEATYTGHDLTAVLARHAFDDTYNVASGANYVDAVTTIAALSGVTRFAIPATTITLDSDLSFAIGTTYLEACNQLLEAIGYYHLAMTPDGKLTSQPTRNMEYVEPYRTVTSDDLMSPVTTQPTDTTVANIVIVVQDNPSEAPLTATRRNDAEDSPTSTVNLGVQTRIETRSNLADQAAVNALAERLLSEGRSFYQTARFTLLPDPAALAPHQTIEIVGEGKLAIFGGRWWVRTATVGFTPGESGPDLEINRVTDAIQGAII